MTRAFHQLFKKLMRVALAACLGLLLLVLPLGQTAQASKAIMSGDFVKDTVSVAQTLKNTIALPNDSEDRGDAETEALELITGYISRYRNRPQFNGTKSFTTMQTALNAMAGHYKTFKNRPLPEKLKERLNKELSRAEKVVVKEI